MDFTYTDLHVSSSLAGEWLDDCLYLVNILESNYMILSAGPSYLVHMTIETGSFREGKKAYENFFGEAFCASQLKHLIERGILVESRSTDSQLPMIPARGDYLEKPSLSEVVILEEGAIQKRLIASPGSSGPAGSS